VFAIMLLLRSSIFRMIGKRQERLYTRSKVSLHEERTCMSRGWTHYLNEQLSSISRIRILVALLLRKDTPAVHCDSSLNKISLKVRSGFLIFYTCMHTATRPTVIVTAVDTRERRLFVFGAREFESGHENITGHAEEIISSRLSHRLTFRLVTDFHRRLNNNSRRSDFLDARARCKFTKKRECPK